MNEELVSKIRIALQRSWSPETSVCYSENAPASYGQCAPTSIVIWERFGGEILKSDGWPRMDNHSMGRHFYNRIDGTRYDFTADQFEDPEYSHKIEYKDLVSSFEEAKTETLPGQIDAMRTAFEKAFSEIQAG